MRAGLTIGMRIVSRATLLGATVLTAWLPSSSHAEAPNLLAQGFALGAGTYVINTDTTMRVDGEVEGGDVVPGTEIDWEQTFGKGDVNRLRVDAQWRFAERHKLRLLAFEWSRSDTRQIDEEIVWDGETFPVDAIVTAERDIEVIELAYEYAFLRREDYEVAASVGVHLMELGGSLSASTDQGGGETIESEASTDAPLPVFGLRGTWRLGGSFWLDSAAQYFAISIDEYDGSLVNLRAALVWQPRSWAGLGIGYDYFKIDAEVDADSFRGELEWSYDGPQVFYNVSF
jgi:hypothetical protein